MPYFLVYLFLEVLITVEVFSFLGGVGSFLEIILSAFIGFGLLANFRHSLKESFTALREQSISPQTFQTLSILTMVGAFLLILPGVLSDTIGLLTQFGSISTFFINRFAKKPKQNQNFTNQNDDVIDVEVIEEHVEKNKF